MRIVHKGTFCNGIWFQSTCIAIRKDWKRRNSESILPILIYEIDREFDQDKNIAKSRIAYTYRANSFWFKQTCSWLKFC